MISYYLKAAAGEDVKITIADAAGKVIRNLDGTKKGRHQSCPLGSCPNPPAADAGRGARGGGGGGGGGAPAAVDPGTYIVTLNAAGKSITKPINVLQDRWLNER